MVQAQEGALWSSVIRFGPYWRSYKILCANIVNTALDEGTRNMIRLLILSKFGVVKNILAQLWFGLSQLKILSKTLFQYYT